MLVTPIFESSQYVPGNGKSLHIGVESEITALIVVNDTEVKGINTFHGKVEFIQFVGITQRELELLKEDSNQLEFLIDNMKKDNPFLITDMNRIKSYL